LNDIKFTQTVKTRKKTKETTRQHTERILQYANKIIPATNNLLETVAKCGSDDDDVDDDDDDDNDGDNIDGKHRKAALKIPTKASKQTSKANFAATKNAAQQKAQMTEAEQETQKQKGQEILNNFYVKFPHLRPTSKPHTPEVNNLLNPLMVNVTERPSDLSCASENNGLEPPIVNTAECLSEVFGGSENKGSELPIVDTTERPSVGGSENKGLEPPIVNTAECLSEVFGGSENKGSELPIVDKTERPSVGGSENKGLEPPIVNTTECLSEVFGGSENKGLEPPRAVKRVIEGGHNEVSPHAATSRRRIRSERRTDSTRECSCGCGTITTTYQLCPTANYKSKCPNNNVISLECASTGWVCCIDCKKTNKKARSVK